MKNVIYQVLTRSWQSGKFSDWDDAAFEYVRSLGCNFIWFTGIPRHSSGKPWVKGCPGSPYAISDYYDVNPYLADNEDERMSEFESLIKRVHTAGLRAMVDFVPNHIAPDYSDSHGGIPHFQYCDYDWTDTLKIDYSNPGTWEKMKDIVLYWASKGVDGIRCDMVELVPVEFFAYLVREVKSSFPDLIFVAEVYERNNYRAYLDAGFDLLYDKSGIYDTLRAIMCCDAPVSGITDNWQKLGDMQSRMLNFLENHDEQRLASGCFLGKPDKAYAALALAALFNNASFMLYAGQEIGESAEESDNGRSSIFNFSVIMKKVDKSVLKRYREILLPASTPLFSEGGNWDLQYCNIDSPGYDSARHFSFLRYNGCSAALVFCNFSDTVAEAQVRIPEEAKQKCRPSVKDSVFVSAGPWDAGIYFL